MNVKELETRLRLGTPLSEEFKVLPLFGGEKAHVMERRTARSGRRFHPLCTTQRFPGVSTLHGYWDTGGPLCERCLYQVVFDPWLMKRMLGE